MSKRLKIADLKFDPQNARVRTAKGEAMIQESLRQVGAARSIVIDEDGSPDANGQFRMTTTVSTITEHLKEVVVTVDIRNPVSLGFDGESEMVQTYYADFQMGSG